MSDAITITLPTVDETIISTIEAETTSAHNSETEAITAIREKYAHLAKHNGDIKIGRRIGGTSNYRFDDCAFLKKDGRNVKGLLCFDLFEKDQTSEWAGRFSGERLYLTSDGWIEISRSGSWSAYQNSTDIWTCGPVCFDNDSEEDTYDYPDEGHVRPLTDAEVVGEGYPLLSICETLGKSLATMAEKLPGRLTRIRERAALATELLTALQK